MKGLYDVVGQFEEAIAEHQMERHVSEALQDRIGEAVACRKLGECYCKLGQYEKAIKLQNQHLSLAQECHDKVGPKINSELNLRSPTMY